MITLIEIRTNSPRQHSDRCHKRAEFVQARDDSLCLPRVAQYDDLSLDCAFRPLPDDGRRHLEVTFAEA